MTKTKNKPKCRCKHICALCEHYMEGRVTNFSVVIPSRCALTERKEIDCISGNTEIVYDPCENINCDGDCSGYKVDKEKKLKKDIITALKEYKHNLDTKFNYDPHRVEKFLINELIKKIETGSCKLSYSYEECGFSIAN